MGHLWLLAAHYAAFKLRLFLLEEEREDWAEPVPLPLCGLCKHVFAGWQPKLSWLQSQRVCRGKIMVLTGRLWGKHPHNLFIRWLLLRLSSGFTSRPICRLRGWEPLLPRPRAATRLGCAPRPKLPAASAPFPFFGAEVGRWLSNVQCLQPSW